MEQFVPLTFNQKNIADLRENYNLSIGQFQATNSVNKEAFYQTKFQLAHALILSENLRDINEGIDFLKQLIREHENMTANRDYAYFIAIGLLRQKKYEDCMRKCEQILRVEPGNHQVKQLLVAAEKELRKEGLIGVGIAAGASLFGALAIGGLAAVAAAKRK
ncbi:unnamed protein product [Oikopleura dioica]|uniref:Mitochondrial fission 1 protein n=1 Tax=Oikopleura dioica TaxID=34765 RepID=E4Y8C1_OIKDI|nr:unnamed protein product [Oikopleura dioica]